MGRWLLAILIGLVGAGIVHILVLFLVPEVSDHGPWEELAASAPLQVFARVDEDRVAVGGAPFFHAAACRFDLGAGPVRVRAEGRVPFWSMAVFDRFGQNVFGVNDRTAEGGGGVDLLLLTPTQMVELQKAVPEGLERTVYVESAPELGIVVLRAFMPDDTWKGLVDRFLGSASCRPL